MIWEMVKLKDVANIIAGVTFSKSESTKTVRENTFPVIRAGNIQNGCLTLSEDLVYVDASKVKEDQLIQKGDIIMCTSSGSSKIVGKCGIARENWSGSYGAFNAGIRAKKSINSSEQ